MYCTYLTIYKGNLLPPFYIGYTTVSKILSGYNGSVSSKEYKILWEIERECCPELFDTKIIKMFDTKEEALHHEEYLHKHFRVHKNPMYVNRQVSVKSFYPRAAGWKHTDKDYDQKS